jgi:hypothetical protein
MVVGQEVTRKVGANDAVVWSQRASIPTRSHGVMVTNTIVMHVIVTMVTVAVWKCANIGWRLDEAPGKMARPSGWKMAASEMRWW